MPSWLPSICRLRWDGVVDQYVHLLLVFTLCESSNLSLTSIQDSVLSTFTMFTFVYGWWLWPRQGPSCDSWHWLLPSLEFGYLFFFLFVALSLNVGNYRHKIDLCADDITLYLEPSHENLQRVMVIVKQFYLKLTWRKLRLCG